MNRLLCAVVFFCVTGIASASPSEAQKVKSEILALAASFAGKPDPDGSLQRQLDPLVARLISLRPQPSVDARLAVLQGAWRQVWGPYNYRSLERTRDPSLDPYSIFQYVKADGTYVNVCIVTDKGDRAQRHISLLPGRWARGSEPNHLTFAFTGYYGLRDTAAGLPALGDLARRFAHEGPGDAKAVVPGWLVRLLANDGVLDEVFTDETLRLLYAYPHGRPELRHLYVMERVGEASPAQRED